MKKGIVNIFIAILLVSIVFCGCFEENNGDKVNTAVTTGKTVTMNATELREDMDVRVKGSATGGSDGSSSTSISFEKCLFNSLEEGDTLKIEDNIKCISYREDDDLTYIYFQNKEGNYSGCSLDYCLMETFKGDLTDTFEVGDTVRITGNILYLNFSLNNCNYEFEIFEDKWLGESYFLEHRFGPLDEGCIEKV